MGKQLSKALGQEEAAPQQATQQEAKPQTDPLDTRPQGVRQKDYGGEAPFGRDGGGKAFQSQVHADCYARSASAKAARLATRRDLATEDNEDYGEAQAGRDADAADAAFAAFLSDDASKPCVLVQVAKYTLADKFCRLANDVQTSAKVLPGLKHGGAVAPSRRRQRPARLAVQIGAHPTGLLAHLLERRGFRRRPLLGGRGREAARPCAAVVAGAAAPRAVAVRLVVPTARHLPAAHHVGAWRPLAVPLRRLRLRSPFHGWHGSP